MGTILLESFFRFAMNMNRIDNMEIIQIDENKGFTRKVPI